MFEPCPCGGATYLSCCAPLHLAQLEAETPERLMRARYSAFARADAGFVHRSWSPETRPARLQPLGPQRWRGLTIERTEMRGKKSGIVAFSARYEHEGREGVLRETSVFRKEAGRWFYLRAEA
ncbi:MAG: YchJ family metal-binding protein [Pseudomonadota bacterium]